MKPRDDLARQGNEELRDFLNAELQIAQTLIDSAQRRFEMGHRGASDQGLSLAAYALGSVDRYVDRLPIEEASKFREAAAGLRRKIDSLRNT